MTAEKAMEKIVSATISHYSEEDDHFIGTAVGILVKELVKDAVAANSRRIADVDAFLAGIKLGLDANFHRK